MKSARTGLRCLSNRARPRWAAGPGELDDARIMSDLIRFQSSLLIGVGLVPVGATLRAVLCACAVPELVGAVWSELADWKEGIWLYIYIKSCDYFADWKEGIWLCTSFISVMLFIYCIWLSAENRVYITCMWLFRRLNRGYRLYVSSYQSGYICCIWLNAENRVYITCMWLF